MQVTSLRPTGWLLAGAWCMVAAGGPVTAQDALVLSGGGSRGVAHAGAIVGLERRGFRPDLVVGASMGAIIGGLYASGMPPDSIWALMRSQDWQEIFAPSVEWSGPSRDALRPMIRLSVFAESTRYADGLIADWRINRALVRLFLDPVARARSDFDALPRRFRSVAADLRTGDPVVTSSGDLALAIRASMSVPGVFAPVLRDGTALVDGGLADYLPIGPARRAGADRVVAVDVIRPPRDRIGLNPFRVALRSLRVTLSNARRDHETADVEITPAIDPDLFAAVFLRDPEPLLEAGLDAALAIPPMESRRPDRPARPAPTVLAGVRVESNDPALETLVRDAFERAAIDGFSSDRILDAADDLYATGLFEGIWPRVEPGGTSDTLVVRADAFAPSSAMGAAGYDTDRGFRGWASWRQRLGGRTEATLAGLAIGIDRRASGTIRSRVSNRWPSVALEAGASIGSHDIREFEGDDPSDVSRVTRAGGWLGFGMRRLTPDIDGVVQVMAERIRTEGTEGVSWGPAVRISVPGSNARFVGQPLRVEAEWWFGDLEYRRYRAAGSLDIRRGVFQAAAVGDLTVVRGAAPADALPALGNAHGVPGLRWGRGRGRSMVVGGADLAIGTPFESHTRLRLRAGTVADDAPDLGAAGWTAAAGIGVMWWTPLGQVAVEAGLAEGGTWLFGLDIGPVF